MTLKFDPWGDDPLIEWDEFNERKVWAHRVSTFEVEDCFENEHIIRPHKKAKSEPEKYADRYAVIGKTNGGRKLIIIVQFKGANIVRPITAWDADA